MGRYAQEGNSGSFEQAPAGSHAARCISIIDLGTQTNDYQGEIKSASQILVTFELGNELMKDGKPFIASKFLTNSLHEKANLRKILINWRGRDFTPEELEKFDLQSILGAPCILSVVQNEKGKSVIEGVMKLAKGMTCPDSVNKPYAFWLDEFDAEVFDNISDGIKNIIRKSPEFAALSKVGTSEESFSNSDDSEDIPF